MIEVVVDTERGENRAAAEAGEALLDVALGQDLDIPFGCTSARCGICQVEVLDGGLAPAAELERATLEQFGCAPAVRLACQAKLRGDVRLRPVS